MLVLIGSKHASGKILPLTYLNELSYFSNEEQRFDYFCIQPLISHSWHRNISFYNIRLIYIWFSKSISTFIYRTLSMRTLYTALFLLFIIFENENGSFRITEILYHHNCEIYETIREISPLRYYSLPNPSLKRFIPGEKFNCWNAKKIEGIKHLQSPSRYRSASHTNGEI